MINWKSYQSIENSYNRKYLNYILPFIKPEDEWVVSEKVDGSNGSYIITEDDIRMAKRSCVISNDSNFDGMAKNLALNYEKFRKMFNLICKYYPDSKIQSIIVYGENCGGYYNHPDVEKVKGASGIQKRVQYHPDNIFLAFDIVIVEKKNDEENIFNYVDHDQFVGLCSSVDLRTVPILFIGSLKECLAYPNNFQSIIPYVSGLPKIENNVAEGVVIKPVKNRFIPDGSRIILKNKNEQFSEKKQVKKMYNVTGTYPEHLEKEINILESFITKNRLLNIISHYENVTGKDFGMILGEFNKDVLGDIVKEYGNIFDSLKTSDYKYIKKHLNKLTSNLIKEWLMGKFF